MLRLLLVLVVMIGVYGCGSDDKGEVKEPTDEATVFDDQTEALEKAKQVEELTNDRMNQLNSELEGDETTE